MIKRRQNTESKPRIFKNIPNSAAPSKKSSADMRDHAYTICRNYLSGSWKSISPSDMVFKSITGGLTNLIYYCSLPETHTPLVGEPGQALLRMYGQIHDGQRDVVESVIFMMLSERKLGPQLYGIFPGGRLEEYIPARALLCDELRDPEISATIARKLACVHSLNVPIKKEPTWLYDTMTTWLASIRSTINVESVNPPSSREMAKKLLSHDLEDELQWLWSFLNQVGSPVVFCHNDLQEGNILFPNDMTKSEDKVVFIDFEFCSYNFRAFDLANHFLEYCYDYSHKEYPYYSVNMDNYPSEAQQVEFIRNYLISLRENSDDSSGPVSEEELHHQISAIIAEVSCFTLASHFLWTLWAISNAIRSKIPFGYWEYGVDRLQAYFEKKQQLVDKNP